MDPQHRPRPVPGAVTGALAVLASLVIGTALVRGPGVPDVPNQTPPAATTSPAPDPRAMA